MLRRPVSFPPFEFRRRAGGDYRQLAAAKLQVLVAFPLDLCLVKIWRVSLILAFLYCHRLVGLVQPLLHISGHDDIEDFFAVRYRFIDDFRIIRVRHSLFYRAVKGAYNFQKMLIERFRVSAGCGIKPPFGQIYDGL